MASSKEFRNYVLEQLRLLDEIDCKLMMGEFLLYYQGTLFGGIYDDRLLVKATPTNVRFNLKSVVPYPGAKPMYLIEDIDDAEMVKKIVLATCQCWLCHN